MLGAQMNGQREKNDDSDQITALLNRCTDGDVSARADLVSAIYPELKRIAEQRMRCERRDHTLQATALVSEFFLQMARRGEFHWRSRQHFLAAASRAMRNLLVDYARSRNAATRGGGVSQLQLNGLGLTSRTTVVDLLEITTFLDRLAEEEPRMAQVAEMRCFGGLTNEEIGDVLGIDERTVKRDWQVAKAWLLGQLGVGATNDRRRVGTD